ncbi:MAG: hypothetical protein R3208_14265 [Ketobacteraceae bacterium]|nr:hypothetical protein [Ketobacteraceae bacterium]
MNYVRILSFFVLFLQAGGAVQAYSEVTLPPLDRIDAYKVIQISGKDVPNALGVDISELSLAAIIDDVLEPVPYQIDEYNTGGAIYFENWDVPIDGTKDLMDPNDKLLFMFKDAGPRKEKHHFVDGELVAEIQLTDKKGIKRYAYLLRHSKLRSQEQYVRYSSELAQVETDFYSLTYDKENHLKWIDFTARNFVGEPPLDSMKIRMEGGLVTPITQTSLDNDEFVALPIGEVTGPIRSTTQLKVTLWLMNLPILKISLQLHHYPKAMLYDVRVLMPSVRRKLLVDPVLTLSTEGNKLLGATMRTALGPKNGGIVDGVIDATEQQMIESGINQTQNWIWASTQRNLDLVAFFNFLGDTNEPIALQLLDSFDNEDPPERFVGQLPNLGYKILNFPQSGFFGFVVSIYLDQGFEGAPEIFTQDLRTPPEIRVLTAG